MAVTLLFVLLFFAKVALPMPLPAPVIFGVGFVGIGMNSVALVKGERALGFLAIAVLVGAFILLWVGGEVLFPH